MSWDWASGFFDRIIAILPLSPFQRFVDWFDNLPYLKWFNWFFPVTECLSVLAVWLVAVALFYLYSVIMRWVKLIGD